MSAAILVVESLLFAYMTSIDFVPFALAWQVRRGADPFPVSSFRQLRFGKPVYSLA